MCHLVYCHMKGPDAGRQSDVPHSERLHCIYFMQFVDLQLNLAINVSAYFCEDFLCVT